jgi:hypothetical protein
MRQTSAKEMEAVLRLDGPTRFSHFVKRVVDAEAAWGLWNDGWILLADDEGTQVFPLWPATEYAEAFRTGEWVDCVAEEIELERLLGELLPQLAAQGKRPGVFPIPERMNTVVPTVDELTAALRTEMLKYGDE